MHTDEAATVQQALKQLCVIMPVQWVGCVTGGYLLWLERRT
jgi:hypothetical protein